MTLLVSPEYATLIFPGCPVRRLSHARFKKITDPVVGYVCDIHRYGRIS